MSLYVLDTDTLQPFQDADVAPARQHVTSPPGGLRFLV